MLTDQTYLPLANMMTAAAMIGIDSCPIEGFHQQKLNRVIQEQLNIDTDLFSMSYIVTFGYRLNEASTKIRSSMSEVTQWF